MRESPAPTVEILGVRFHALTEQETVASILDALDAGRGGIVVTANLDHVRRCARDDEYRGFVAAADLVVADGVPLVWASRIARTPLPGLVAGSNLISSLAEGCARRGRSVYLLGGVPGAAEGAAKVLQQRCEGLRVAGTWCPPFGFEKDAREVGRIEDDIARTSPDVVFVGLGSPKQEWTARDLRAKHPNAWWIGVGISFSYLTGDVRRAPVWMRKCGLEWAYRLGSEPVRLARRYLVEGIPYGVRLLGWAVRRRLAGARRVAGEA